MTTNGVDVALTYHYVALRRHFFFKEAKLTTQIGIRENRTWDIEEEHTPKSQAYTNRPTQMGWHWDFVTWHCHAIIIIIKKKTSEFMSNGSLQNIN